MTHSPCRHPWPSLCHPLGSVPSQKGFHLTRVTHLEDRSSLSLCVVINTCEVVEVLSLGTDVVSEPSSRTNPFHVRVLVASTGEIEPNISS